MKKAAPLRYDQVLNTTFFLSNGSAFLSSIGFLLDSGLRHLRGAKVLILSLTGMFAFIPGQLIFHGALISG